MKSIIFLFAFLFLNSLAQGHSKREHKAHAHGAARLSLAFEKGQGEVEFECPAESIVGFEHEAQSTADKKTQTDALKKLETQLPQILQFESSLACEFKTLRLEVTSQKNHGDVEGRFAVTCKKSPVGSTLKIDMSSFARVKKMDLQFLSESVQKGVDIKSFPFELKIQ